MAINAKTNMAIGNVALLESILTMTLCQKRGYKNCDNRKSALCISFDHNFTVYA